MNPPPSDAKRLERRNRELSILNAFARELNAQVDLKRALQAALSQVAELLDLRTGWVWLLHEESGQSYLAAAQNLPPALAEAPWRMEGIQCAVAVIIVLTEGAAHLARKADLSQTTFPPATA